MYFHYKQHWILPSNMFAPKITAIIKMILIYFVRHVWAERLLAHIMEPRWTKQWMFRIVRGQYSEEEYNKEMNALFVKLHLLDPQLVIPAFQFLMNQKGKFRPFILDQSHILHWECNI